jgi:hypothetical protein
VRWLYAGYSTIAEPSKSGVENIDRQASWFDVRVATDAKEAGEVGRAPSPDFSSVLDICREEFHNAFNAPKYVTRLRALD